MVDNLQVKTRPVPSFRLEDNGITLPDGRAASELLGDSMAMQHLLRQVAAAGQSRANILICGETGSGRRLVARSIHLAREGADAPLIVAACSDGICAVLDAVATLARLSKASGGASHAQPRGTLVLDGLTELSPGSQLEVLHQLGMTSDEESGTHTPKSQLSNGYGRSYPNLMITLEPSPGEAAAQGLLHPRALELLAATQLRVPPLRDRGDDVEILAHYFLALLNSEEGTAKHFSGVSLMHLREHTWPGNVRELRSVVQRAFVAADQELDLAVERSELSRRAIDGEAPALRIVVGTSLADAERWMIAATLKKCGGNKTRAAALLGVSLKTLYNRLNAYRAQGVDISSVDREMAEVPG